MAYRDGNPIAKTIIQENSENQKDIPSGAEKIGGKCLGKKNDDEK